MVGSFDLRPSPLAHLQGHRPAAARPLRVPRGLPDQRVLPAKQRGRLAARRVPAPPAGAQGGACADAASDAELCSAGRGCQSAAATSVSAPHLGQHATAQDSRLSMPLCHALRIKLPPGIPQTATLGSCTRTACNSHAQCRTSLPCHHPAASLQLPPQVRHGRAVVAVAAQRPAQPFPPPPHVLGHGVVAWQGITQGELLQVVAPVAEAPVLVLRCASAGQGAGSCGLAALGSGLAAGGTGAG